MVASEMVAGGVRARGVVACRLARMRRLRRQRLDAAARKPGGVVGPGPRICWGEGVSVWFGGGGGKADLFGGHLHVVVVLLVEDGARVAVAVRDFVVEQVQRPPDAAVLFALEVAAGGGRLVDVQAERVGGADGGADVEIGGVGVAFDLEGESLWDWSVLGFMV